MKQNTETVSIFDFRATCLARLERVRRTSRLDRRQVRQYLTCMTTVLSTKGQIVLPAEIRKEDDIRPGQQFEIERIDRGEYRITRKTQRRNAGLVKLLLACPAKGWFKPMDRTETTDHVVARRSK